MTVAMAIFAPNTVRVMIYPADEDGPSFPYRLNATLGRRRILIPYASRRQAEAMAPALARALVQAPTT